MSESRRVFTATEAEVGSFAALTTDKNPLHVDSEYAEDAFFGERVVHGVFTLGWVSSMLADLPVEGDVILTGLINVDFLQPVHFNESVEVSVEYDEEDVETIGFRIVGVKNGDLKTEGAASVYVADSVEV